MESAVGDDLVDRFGGPADEAELQRLAAQVRLHSAMLDEASLRLDHVDRRLSEQIATVLLDILEMSSGLPEDERRMVAATARYYIVTLDGTSDLDVQGLGDDAAVVGALCERLGRRNPFGTSAG